jgi:hypothetical protein
VATTDRLELLGAAASVSTVLMLVGLLGVVYGRGAVRPLLAILAELGPPIALAAAIYGVAWCVTLAVSGRAAAVAAATVATAAYLATLRSRLPGHWELVRRLLAPLAALRPSAADSIGT